MSFIRIGNSNIRISEIEAFSIYDKPNYLMSGLKHVEVTGKSGNKHYAELNEKQAEQMIRTITEAAE